MLLWDFFGRYQIIYIYSFECVLVLVLLVSKVARVTTEPMKVSSNHGNI